MAPIYVNNFVGAVKLVDPRLLEDNMATEAINCELEAGTIENPQPDGFRMYLAVTAGAWILNVLYKADAEL